VAIITARGKYIGIDRLVKCFEISGLLVIEVDGERRKDIQARFNQLVADAPTLGGTYYPPPGSMLAAYSVLESAFFDMGSPVRIRVEGDIGEIPTYDDIEGIVY
jgi:hypothetical protein